MSSSSSSYITVDGDMVDDIAFKTYNDETMIEFILMANPGLVDQPLFLPRGIEILLPDAPIGPAKNPILDIWA
jgi:phage tail protein X